MDAHSFAAACAAAPLDLMVERAEDSAVIAHGRLDQPYAVIGRDPNCDIHLNDPAVALRHAFAQVVNGQLFVVDLASTTGTRWPSGKQNHGWLRPGEALGIGPFHIYLMRAPSRGSVLTPDFHPLTSTTDIPGGLPPVVVEFLSGKSEHTAWEVNRVLTLVGRANECKLHLAGEDIALYHAAFVKTIVGLWVVDLLARGGCKVNGKPVRAELLKHGDELHIGKFAMGVKYPAPPRPSGEDSAVSFNVNDSLGLKSSARIGPPPDTMTAPADALPVTLETLAAMMVKLQDTLNEIRTRIA